MIPLKTASRFHHPILRFNHRYYIKHSFIPSISRLLAGSASSSRKLLAKGFAPGISVYSFTSHGEASVNTAAEIFPGSGSSSIVTSCFSRPFLKVEARELTRRSFRSLFSLSTPVCLLSGRPTSTFALQGTRSIMRPWRSYSTFEPASEMARRRPTKAELLANASGFYNRLMIRVKFLLMRQVRPFTMEDIVAMFSWVFVGNTLFIVIGTTTFFSLLLAAANSLQFQEFIARRIGNYLTKETGITVVFESAIVPNWKDGKIRLKNVTVARLPDNYDLQEHVVHAEAESYDQEVDTNFTMFYLNVEMIDVELSFMRWLDGKSLVKNATVKGIRGVVDRRNVYWDPDVPYNPAEWRRKSQPGDFELESFQVEDLLITVYQPNDFRPYSISVFSADLPRLREQWLLYDLICAEKIIGMFDNCLFSVHRPQIHEATTEQDLKGTKLKKKSCLRIDGVNIDHLNTGVPGPFGWITSGTVDIRADVMIPMEPNTDPIKRFVNDIVDKIDDVVIQQRASLTRGKGNVECEAQKDSEPPVLVTNLEIKFHDVKASVPLLTEDLSYMNNALIRPIVAFINNNRILLSVQCQVTKQLVDFDGSWTLYDCGLADDVSTEVGKAFAELTMNAQKRNRQLKRVGIWGLQTMTKNLVSVWDYATGNRGFWHYIGTMAI